MSKFVQTLKPKNMAKSKTFKLKNNYFRASSTGDLMTGCKPNTVEHRFTELQAYDFNKLVDRIADGDTLPPSVQKKYDNLLNKLNTPNELSDTAKGYCMDVFLQEVYGYKDDISTPQMRKGILAEDDSLKLLSEHLGEPLFKNQKRYIDKNSWLAGTPDAISKDTVYDVKTSWSPKTFMKAGLPSQYEWQLRAYLMLTGLEVAYLAYCLVDMPIEIFTDLERRAQWQKGILDPDSEEGLELTTQLEAQHFYDNNPKYKEAPRVKLFKIERDETLEQMLKEQLERAKNFTERLTLDYYPPNVKYMVSCPLTMRIGQLTIYSVMYCIFLERWQINFDKN